MKHDSLRAKRIAVLVACAAMILAVLATQPGMNGDRSDPIAPAGTRGEGPTPDLAPAGSVAKACDGVTTCTTGAIANVDSGDTLVVVVTEFTTSAGIPSAVEEVTTGGDHQLALLGSTPCIAGSGHGVTAIYGLANVTAQTSITFTVNYSGAEYYTIHALDVEGVGPSPFETAGAGVCSAAMGTTATAAVDPTVAGDLVILGVEVRASTTIAASGTDTVVTDAATTGADLDSGAMLEEIDGATGSISLSATFASASWSALAVALKNAPLVSGAVSPAASAIDAGQTLGLTSTAATGGTAPITYQWYASTSTSTCSSGTLIVGAIGPTYTPPALSVGTYYYCVWAVDASLPLGQVVTSNVATITVNPDLVVAIAPSAPSVASGQTIELMAQVTGGTGMDSYAWYAGASCTGTVLATTQNYTTSALTAATTYCVAVTDSSSVPATTTAPATVTISPSGSRAPSPPWVYPVAGALAAAALAALLLVLLFRRPRKVTFTEEGLPENANWWVTWNGAPMSSTTSRIDVNASRGTHSFTVKDVAGYTPHPSQGTVTVERTSVDVKIAFTPRAP
jgi:hypothetical protein